MKLASILLSVLATALQFGIVSWKAPAKPQPLLEIVSNLEEQGYGPIVEASMDDRNWEVEVYKEGLCYELKIDPVSGEILSEHRDDADLHPSSDAKPLSNILKGLQQAEYTSVVEASYEGSHWEVEAYRGGAKRELRIDPKTGEILSDRIDD